MSEKKRIRNSFIWSAIDSLGSQIIGLVISVILAKMLGPSVFGLVAMVSIFMAIANVFVNSGFNSALIRKLDRSEVDFSTTFYFSLVVSVLCYIMLFMLAPYIADFYVQQELVLIIRLMSFIIIINTFAVIPRVKLTVNLKFKVQAKAHLIALFFSSLAALFFAYLGYGVWVLVLQQLIMNSVNVIMLNLFTPWWPRENFSRHSFKELFGFGSKLLLSGLLDTIYTNLYGLIIGKYFSVAQLGLFNQAQKFSNLPAMILTNIIQQVTYPMLSAMQNDKNKFDAAYLLTLRLAAFTIFPIMFAIFIISDPLIDLLLGSEWKRTATLLSIISMALVLYPIHAINLNLLQVKGRSDLFLKLEVIKKVIESISLIITVPMGIEEMCIGMVVCSYLALFINTYYTGKLSSLTVYKQLKSLLPIGVIAALSAHIGLYVGNFAEVNYIKIMIMLSVALILYLLIMFFFQKTLLISLKNIMKN